VLVEKCKEDGNAVNVNIFKLKIRGHLNCARFRELVSETNFKKLENLRQTKSDKIRKTRHK
jgi:hypothetical protein